MSRNKLFIQFLFVVWFLIKIIAFSICAVIIVIIVLNFPPNAVTTIITPPSIIRRFVEI